MTDARDEVALLVSSYAVAADQLRYDEVAALFVEAGELSVEGGPTLSGRAAIAEGLKRGAERRRAAEPGHFQRHHLTTAHIEVLSEHRARAVNYVFVVTELGFDHSGMYRDEFEHGEQGWRFVRRTARVDWIRPDSRFLLWLSPEAAKG